MTSICSNEFVADVEAEDVELGNSESDLAFDVDEGMADEDSDALDSDDERPGENEALGIDVDKTESKQLSAVFRVSCLISSCSSHAYSASVLSFAQ
jgi:hypothetical protein